MDKIDIKKKFELLSFNLSVRQAAPYGLFFVFFGANFSSNQLERLSVVHRSQVDIGRVNFCLLCFYFRLQFITYLLTVFKLKLCYDGLNLKCKTSLN